MTQAESRLPATLASEPRQGLVDIVTVNWNAGDLLRNCVSSIALHGAHTVRTATVVDNGSSDGSDLLDCPDERFRILRMRKNLGFGRACNLGAKLGTAPYLLFLNPDAALFEDSLEKVVRFLERPENAGIGVCGVRLLGEAGVLQRHCAPLPSTRSLLLKSSGIPLFYPSISALYMDGFDHVTSRSVDHVTGAFYLIRRELYERLGGFDERFFVGFEDTDLSARVRSAGFDVYYLASAVGFHRGGGSFSKVVPTRLAYFFEGRILYALKHLNPVGALMVVAATLFWEPIPRLGRAMLRRSRVEARQTLQGYGLLWRKLAHRISGAP